MSKTELPTLAARPVPFAATAHVRDTCLCLHMQRAARVLARRFDEALRPCGLTNGQFSLLMALNRPEPPAMAAVARVLAIDRTTLTAALKPLQRRGLVQIAAIPDDRRGRRLALTPAGLQLLAQALPIWQATHRAVDMQLDSDDSAAEPEGLRRQLRSLSGNEPA